MRASHYKGPWIGKTPMCAICAGPGDGERALHYLTHGVTVWLCEGHRSIAFQRRRGGRDFVASLAAVWNAAGIRSRRHERALAAHLRRVRPGPPARDRPGSYAWQALRSEAERRFTAGERPDAVIDDLTRRGAGHASAPSRRTVRRWFADGRWITRRAAVRQEASGRRPLPARHVAVTGRSPEAPSADLASLAAWCRESGARTSHGSVRSERSPPATASG